ncbi:GNAT family N-acetyltransferase [Pseudofrankia sp. BMG5.37]|uniref:GNAT family N-acetyltransferase n=1 Tax=Pseudofrankia sp. BMG5.37 TaxID=3050035 RepID=UPI0037C75369
MPRRHDRNCAANADTARGHQNGLAPAGEGANNGRVTRSVAVRPATAADVVALGRLNAVVQELHARTHPTEFCAPDATAAASFFREKLDQPNVLVLLAEEGGRTVGYLYAEEQHREANLFRPRSSVLEIHQICTRSDRRRGGVGRALMTAAEQHAVSWGLDGLRLSTGSFNTDAQQFFASLGYVPYSIRLMRRL